MPERRYGRGDGESKDRGEEIWGDEPSAGRVRDQRLSQVRLRVQKIET